MAALHDGGSGRHGGESPSVVGTFDSKTHLAELLDRVERGEEITITRRGVPVAKLAPVAGKRTGRPASVLRAEFLAFRRAHPLDGVTTGELIDECRRR